MHLSHLKRGAAVAAVAATTLTLCLGASPAQAARGGDSDRDGLPNRFEVKNKLNPNSARDAKADLDKDGLTNLQEFRVKTNPRKADTDRDTLKDGVEVEKEGTNPRSKDTDRDRVNDGVEVRGNTNPRDRDTDDDGVRDGVDKHTVYGQVVSYDGETRVLTITRVDGTVVTGLVADSTRIKFEDGDHRGGSDDDSNHDSDDDSNNGGSDDDGSDDGSDDSGSNDDSNDDGGMTRAASRPDNDRSSLVAGAEVLEVRYAPGAGKFARIVLAR